MSSPSSVRRDAVDPVLLRLVAVLAAAVAIAGVPHPAAASAGVVADSQDGQPQGPPERDASVEDACEVEGAETDRDAGRVDAWSATANALGDAADARFFRGRGGASTAMRLVTRGPAIRGPPAAA